MSDFDMIRELRRNDERLRLTEVKEVPGAGPSFSSFYEVGTWTPTYTGAATAGVTTYTNQAGYYTRIGRALFFTGYLAWTNATGTGGALLSLPFTAANLTDGRYAVALRINAITFANAGVEGLILPNTNFVSLWTPASNVVTTQIAVEAAGDLSYTGFFFLG